MTMLSDFNFTLDLRVTYDVSSPTPSPTSGEVGQTGGQTWHRFSGIQAGTLHQPIHLHGAQGEIVNERMARRNKFRALLNNSSAGGLVGFVNDEGEILRAHKRGGGSLDLIKAGSEPLGRSGKVREITSLPIDQY